jgi:hypothetical protein
MDANEANWNLLPHNALAFFGLAEGFDRKDLKRAYGKLIRVYKPETHPQDFQRIREAYEQLESQHRYGVQRQLNQLQIDAWTQTIARDTVAKQRAGSTTSNQREVATATKPPPEAKSPEDRYRQLLDCKDKTPQDFFTLALLSDIVDTKDPQRFIKWLLTGLKHFPDDPGLGRLTREYLGSDVSLDDATSILGTLCKLVPANVFYQVTEPLWNRIFSNWSYEKYSKLLDACESKFVQGAIRAKLAFYIQAFRRLVWTANADWLRTKWAFVSQHGTEIPPGMDQELEMCSALFEYVLHDRKRIGVNSIRKTIDDMLHSYCNDPWSIAAAKVARAQDELARSSLEFTETFAWDHHESDQRVLMLATMVAHETMTQSGIDYSKADETKLFRHATAAVNDMAKESEPIWQKNYWLQARIYWIPYICLVFLPLTLVWDRFSFHTTFWVIFIWVIVSSFAYYFALKPLWIDTLSKKRTRRLIVYGYETVWRPRLFRYVQSCNCQPSEAIEALQEMSYHAGQKDLIGMVLSFAGNDLGLRTFHLAQNFAR